MTINRKPGSVGLSIPVVNPSTAPKNKMSSSEVAKWCNTLPMADVGAASKKLYLALSDLNNTALPPEERFQILEVLREPLKAIGTELKKHYIEQKHPLTPNQLTIASLRQTLQTEMADNYKTVVEGMHNKPNKTEDDKKILVSAICRVLYYFNIILICRYQLYSYAPKNIWQEIHLLYKYARDNKLLDIKVPCRFSFNQGSTTILESYTKIILLYATVPYQWRQRDQHSINKAIDLWSLYPTIYDSSNIPEKRPGIYIIDLEKDAPPIAYNYINGTPSESCIALDLMKGVHHLQQILDKMQKENFQGKIEHPGDPEFSVTAQIVKKLISIWSQNIARTSPRFPIQAKIKIAFGLVAAHYYLNGEKEFDPNPPNLHRSDGSGRPAQTALDLPVFEITDEDEESALSDEAKKAKTDEQKAEQAAIEEEANAAAQAKANMYHLYDYNMENVSPNGLGIVIRDRSFPPFQAGEIVVFKNATANDPAWSIGAVRWMRRPNDDEFQIGIQIISPYAKAAGIQMERHGKPAGRLIRCLVLPEIPDANMPPMLITSTLPFRTHQVLLYLDQQDGIKTTLTDEVDATGMYLQYTYSTKEVVEIADPAKQQHVQHKEEHKNNLDDDKTNTEFDSIWKDL